MIPKTDQIEVKKYIIPDEEEYFKFELDIKFKPYFDGFWNFLDFNFGIKLCYEINKIDEKIYCHFSPFDDEKELFMKSLPLTFCCPFPIFTLNLVTDCVFVEKDAISPEEVCEKINKEGCIVLKNGDLKIPLKKKGIHTFQDPLIIRNNSFTFSEILEKYEVNFFLVERNGNIKAWKNDLF
jgi:hypothetical protein